MSEEQDFEKLMALREGRRTDVYKDSLGKLTVGIGHLVAPADNLRFGEVISDQRVSALFQADGADALDAARDQASEAAVTESFFVVALASVCFQLGDEWRKKFPTTWKLIVDGKYAEAAHGLDGTLWQKQTPVRVKDFQDALRRL